MDISNQTKPVNKTVIIFSLRCSRSDNSKTPLCMRWCQAGKQSDAHTYNAKRYISNEFSNHVRKNSNFFLKILRYSPRLKRLVTGPSRRPASCAEISLRFHASRTMQNLAGHSIGGRPNLIPRTFAEAIPSVCRWRINSRYYCAT